jgi:hypothetical protein
MHVFVARGKDIVDVIPYRVPICIRLGDAIILVDVFLNSASLRYWRSVAMLFYRAKDALRAN